MNSRIYRGSVMHARQRPVRHRWELPFYFYAIDLDELPELDRTVFGFGWNRWRPVALQERDYLRGSGAFRAQLSEFIDVANIHRIILVTVARFLGRVFNPVSFYYCLNAEGAPVSMVAEVNNTFGERHLYLMEGGNRYPLECRHEKQFHVSPFNTMDGHYEFRFSEPGNELRISIRLVRDGETVMDTALWGSGQSLTSSNLWKTVLRYPFTAGMTMPRILRQAVLLRYKKKLPVYRKPVPASPMTIKEKA